MASSLMPRGQVKIKELKTILRALNIDPTDEELDTLVEKCDPTESGVFKYDALKEVMEEKLKEINTKEDLLIELNKISKNQESMNNP